MDSGPLAGMRLDVTFNADWSVDWRIVAGHDQGRAGRGREFAQQGVQAQLSIVAFPVADGATIAATVDFANRRFTGFLVGGVRATGIAGSLQFL